MLYWPLRAKDKNIKNVLPDDVAPSKLQKTSQAVLIFVPFNPGLDPIAPAGNRHPK